MSRHTVLYSTVEGIFLKWSCKIKSHPALGSDQCKMRLLSAISWRILCGKDWQTSMQSFPWESQLKTWLRSLVSHVKNVMSFPCCHSRDGPKVWWNVLRRLPVYTSSPCVSSHHGLIICVTIISTTISICAFKSHAEWMKQPLLLSILSFTCYQKEWSAKVSMCLVKSAPWLVCGW